jgi:hypothetical protein
VPTNDLQNFFEIQMQQNNEEKNKSQNPKLWYFVWNVLKKNFKPL